MKKSKTTYKRVEDSGVTVYSHATFDFMHEENAQRVCYALARGGYFTRISITNGSFMVHVFSHNKSHGEK